MATEADYDLLREDTGLSESQLDDTKAEAILTEAATKYPSNGDAAFAYARVRALEKNWAKSTEEDVDYTQNEESERLGQRAANKKGLLDYWQGKLDDAIAAAELPKGQRPAFFGLAKASNRRWFP